MDVCVCVFICIGNKRKARQETKKKEEEIIYIRADSHG